jgi:opacity protein-like surface antigen
MKKLLIAAVLAAGFGTAAQADENLLGYVKGAETLPKGGKELYQFVTIRDGKGSGKYTAIDTVTELEYGVTDKFTISGEIQTLSIDTNGLVIDGYLPKDADYSLKPSAVAVAGKYRFLSAAVDPIGLSATWELEYAWLDPHSGQDKDEYEVNVGLQAQKYLMEGQGILMGNLNMKAGHEERSEIDNLPPGFDWPLDPEMEIEFSAGLGASYRFAPNWFVGVETQYAAEFETEVGLERWSLFAGPSLHYGGEKVWATLTWFPQIVGGGEKYAGQPDQDLHLIEKTENEYRLKIGYNF